MADLIEKRTGRRPSSEESRAALENLVGFFNILFEWDRRDPAKLVTRR